MLTKLQKWGNSLAVRIPAAFAKECQMQSGMEVDISSKDGHLEIKPVTHSKLTLDALLAHITDENLHGEIHLGGARGGEIIDG